MTYGDQVYLFGRALQKHRISCLPPCLVPWDHSEAVPVRWGSPSTATVWQCFLLSVTQFDDLLSLISPRRRRKESMIVSIQIRNISQSSAGEWSDLPFTSMLEDATCCLHHQNIKGQSQVPDWLAHRKFFTKVQIFELARHDQIFAIRLNFRRNALSPDCRGWRSNLTTGHLIVSVHWLNIEPWN